MSIFSQFVSYLLRAYPGSFQHGLDTSAYALPIRA